MFISCERENNTMMKMNYDTSSVIVLMFLICCSCNSIEAQTGLEKSVHQFGPFDGGYYSTFAVLTNATISNKALQITPDSAGNFTLQNRSGRVFFNQSFALWANESAAGARQIASFNTSFLINVFRVEGSATPGEGMAFVIAPSLDVPTNSSGQWLGLTNAATDGNETNRFVAVELDTFKQDFDPDANHLGLDVNSVKSLKTVSLKTVGIEIAPNETRFHMVWIQYDGPAKKLSVYMAEQPWGVEAGVNSEILPRPDEPVMTAEDLDLSRVLARKSYFGFAGSTGSSVQLNCVLRWNLTVDLLPGESIGDTIGGGGSGRVGIKIAVGVAAAVGAALIVAGVGYYVWRRRRATADPTILGALKSLPGMPREFKFSELKKATNKFDEKHNKLGQGGFGVVYRGLLAKEDLEIAVKRFSRDNIQGKDDFLSELTIINRLRHKHLVRLLGWCHENDTLLLVYEYMPNGSLDAHLFCGPEKAVLSWRHRHKIIADVASGLQYLHNEYDQKVIHRDLKASNIMLDASFNARLGDFGLARAIENERTSYADLEAVGVPGTMGYIAPECFHTGRATRESDIYGFGAVVLEVVCGHRPSTKKENFQFLLDWVWWLHREGCLLKAVDERLGAEFDPEQAKRLLLLGLACSHPIAAERPKTQAIVQIISGSVEAPYVPPFKPAFVWPSEMPGGLDLDSSDSNNYSMATSLTTGSSWPVGVSEP